MKAYVLKQWEEICAIEDPSELYRTFLRITKLVLIVLAVVQAFYFYPLINFVRYGIGINPMELILPFLVLLGEIFAISFAERQIPAGKFSGTAIGLAACLIHAPSLYLPFCVFGLFCFLNPAYQKKHLTSAPKWFVDLLKLVNLDFTATSQEARAAEVPKTQF